MQQMSLRPQLELYQNILRMPGSRVPTAKHCIDPLAGHWQLVLNKHLHLGQSGLVQISGEDVQTPPPGLDLARRRSVPDLVAELFGQCGHERPVGGLGTN